MENSPTILQVFDLSKAFPQGFRFGPASFELQAGETVAFIGANGAGKSTLFEMISGNSDPSQGEIRLLGKKLRPDTFLLKRKIGYLPQHVHLPRWVTGLEVLRYAASIYQIANSQAHIERSMAYWDCASYCQKPLAACSHGMQKRVALALASLHHPTCLILDEPFSGLDLYHTRALEEEIIRRQRAGKTTVLSTHIAPYVAKLCQRVYTIQAGQMTQLENWYDKEFMERVAQIENSFFSP